MFQIKICGVRLCRDLETVAMASGDAIGLNFFPNSVRYANPHDVATVGLSNLARHLGLKRIGVFVNASASEIARIALLVGIDSIQLHGNESTAILHPLCDLKLPIIRAIKLPTGTLSPETIDSLSRPWLARGCHLLLDADAGPAHGGSGKTLDWRAIRDWNDQTSDVDHLDWSLAGGLNPENVAEAIAVSGTRSVDVASGVELNRGEKSPERINQFCFAAIRQWQARSNA